MDRVAFSIGDINIYWYGIIMTAAIFIGYILASREGKRLELPSDSILDMCLLVVPFALLGARTYFLAFHRPEALFTLEFFNFRQGGIAMYGSILGGALGAFIYSKWKGISFRLLLDIMAPSVALGQAIGRWGNFFNQEAYGELITNPAMQFFPLAVFIDRAQGWYQATFFYESMWDLLVFCFLYFYMRQNKRRNGDIILWYAVLYCAGRAVIEGLRMDSLYAGPIRVSQLFSIVALGVAIIIMASRKKGDKLLTNFDLGLSIVSFFALGVMLWAGFSSLPTSSMLVLQVLCSLIAIGSCAYMYHTSKRFNPMDGVVRILVDRGEISEAELATEELKAVVKGSGEAEEEAEAETPEEPGDGAEAESGAEPEKAAEPEEAEKDEAPEPDAEDTGADKAESEKTEEE